MSNLPSIPPNLPRDPTVTFRNVRATALGVEVDSEEFFRLHLEGVIDAPTLDKDAPLPSPSASFGPAGGSPRELTLSSDVGPITEGALNPPKPTPPPRRTYAFAESLRRVELRGEGGYGEVWEAEQVRLRRRIAVKRIREDIRSMPCSPKAWEVFCERYFRHEAYIAAQLDHPNIVPVHDLEQEPDGSPAILMKLVRGRPWSELLCDDLVTLSPEELLARHLPIFTDVVQAVAFAHSRAIVHRDIKPSQVMVGDYGEVLLMDWGLAISCAPEGLGEFWRPDFTPLPPTTDQANTPAGTPSYMAPEQTREDASLLGPWTDVFLLGSTLYLLVTGRLPYQSATTEETFAKAAKGEWTPLAEAAGGRAIPPELAELVTAAMQPDHRQRRLTAKMMLERLEAFRSGASRRRESEALTQQVADQLARDETEYHAFEVMGNLLSKARECWPGNPRIPVLAEAVTLAYSRAALANADLRLARVQSDLLEPGLDRERIRARIAEAEDTRTRREGQRRWATRAAAVLLVLAVLAAASALMSLRQVELKRQLAESATRNAVANEAEARRLGEKARREQYFASVGYAASSLADNDVLKAAALLATAPPYLRDWEWQYLNNRTHPETDRFTFTEPMLAVAVSPSGQQVANGGENAAIYLVDRETGDRRKLEGHSLKIYALAFSPDGRRLASGSKDTSVRLWDTATGECVRVLEGHRDFVNSVSFHPTDNNLLLTASSDHSAILWNLASGAPRHVTKHSELVRTALFDSTGERYLMATRNRRLVIMRTADGQRLAEYDLHESFSSGLTSAEFSPDNRLIGLTCWDSSAGIVDATTGQVLHVLRGHTDAPYRARFIREGRELVTFGHDGVAVVWDVATGERRFNLEGHSGAIWDGAVAPGGESVMTASYDRTVREWRLADFDPTPRVIEAAALFDPALPAINVPLYFRNDTTYIRVDDYWETPQGGRLVELRDLRLRVLAGRWIWSADGAARVTIGSKAAVQWPGGERPDLPLSEAPVVSAAFRRDGLLAVATPREVIIVAPTLDTVLGRIPAKDEEDDYAKVCFGSRSQHMVCVHDRDTRVHVCLWDAAAARPGDWTKILEHEGAYQDIDAVEVAPDGKWMALGSLANWQVLFVDVASDAVTAIGAGHSDRILSLAVSANGRRLVSNAWDGSLRVWDTATGREFLYMRPEPGAKFFAAQWMPDNARVAAVSSSGRVFVLDGRARGEVE